VVLKIMTNATDLSLSKAISLVTLNANFMSNTEYSGYASLHRQNVLYNYSWLIMRQVL